MPVDITDLVARHGETLAEQAGIDLDSPDGLYQLLVLTLLLSKPISAKAALASLHELVAAGCGSPSGLTASAWRQRVDALGRGGYRRYDFSTADRLAEVTAHVEREWGGDVASIRGCDLDVTLQAVPGIGPTGSAIFRREVSAVWPEVGFVLDAKVRKGAVAAGLPTDAESLATLHPEPHRLATALALVGRKPALLDEVAAQP